MIVIPGFTRDPIEFELVGGEANLICLMVDKAAGQTQWFDRLLCIERVVDFVT